MKTLQNQEVPDEVWLKCFIEDYRKLREGLETLEEYTHRLEEEYNKLATFVETLRLECGAKDINGIRQLVRNQYDYAQKEKKRNEKIKNFHRLVHYCFENGLTVPKYIFDGNEEDE